MSVGITLSGSGTVLRQSFFPPIELGEGTFSIGVLSIFTYNSFCNIVKDVNDSFKFSQIAEPLIFPTGAYDMQSIFATVKEFLKRQGDKLAAGERVFRDKMFTADDLFLAWELIPSSGRVTLKSNLDIDFTIPHSIGPILGFTEPVTLARRKRHIAPSPAKIDPYNSINVSCNLAKGSYFNASPSNVILSFVPEVDVGYKLIHTPTPVLYYELNSNVIPHIEIKLVDEAWKPLNNLGEHLTVVLNIIPG